jgi:hypothetical protein
MNSFSLPSSFRLLAGLATSLWLVSEPVLAASSLKPIELFDSISFTPDANTTQALYTPPFEGSKALRVSFTTGSTWASLTKSYSPAKNFAGKFLHLDVYAENATLVWAASPTVKLKNGATVVYEQRMPVRVGEWTGLNFDLSAVNQTLLAGITGIELYVADSVNPGTVTYRLDNLYVSTVSLPPVGNPKQFIVLATHPEDAAAYQTAINRPNTKFAYRTISWNKNDTVITGFDTAQTPYYYTIASSDFVAFQGQPSIYLTVADINAVLDRPACQGVYLHEVLTYLTASNGWNWNAGIAQFNWTANTGWLDQVIIHARLRGKKVIWSETSAAWKSVLNSTQSPSPMTFLSTRGDVVRLLWATNFQSSGSGYLMTQARDYGAEIAAKCPGMQFGQSHQSWYFTEQGFPVTAASSLALAKLGSDHAGTYYQFEGPTSPVDYLNYGSAYMQGVVNFAAYLNP